MNWLLKYLAAGARPTASAPIIFISINQSLVSSSETAILKSSFIDSITVINLSTISMQVESVVHAFFKESANPFSSPDFEIIGSLEEEATEDAGAELDSSFKFELGGLEVLLGKAALLKDLVHGQSWKSLPFGDIDGASELWLGVEEGLELVEHLLFLLL